MSQFYVPGPAPIALRWWVNGSPESAFFLGFSEGPVSFSFRPMRKDVKASIGGEAALDRMFIGESAVVSAVLSRFNEAVAARALSRAATASIPVSAGPRGAEPPGRIGTMEVLEEACPELMVKFPYSAKPAFANAANGAMVAGYRMPNAMLDHDAFDAGASDHMKRRFIWTCVYDLDMTFSNNFGSGMLTLYDHDMSAFPAID